MHDEEPMRGAADTVSAMAGQKLGDRKETQRNHPGVGKVSLKEATEHLHAEHPIKYSDRGPHHSGGRGKTPRVIR